jgi:hypothetical protein
MRFACFASKSRLGRFVNPGAIKKMASIIIEMPETIANRLSKKTLKAEFTRIYILFTIHLTMRTTRLRKFEYVKLNNSNDE